MNFTDFDPSAYFAAKGAYLNTATVGLPCFATLAAMQSDMARWQYGELDPVEYDEIIDQCRRLFGDLLQVPADWVAIGHQVAPFVTLLAQSLQPGMRILAAENDFTSVLFPFFVRQNQLANQAAHQAEQGLHIELVPLDQLVERLDDSFDWVALSAVQSADGQVADLDALSQKANITGSKILLDATHAVSWLTIKPQHWHLLISGAYKWLLSPRGTAFAALRPELMADIPPLMANWYAGDTIWQAIYGAPLRLAATARRYDVSPAWMNWVGTLPALQLIKELGVTQIGEHNVGLANRFRRGIGLPGSNSAIVSIRQPGVDERLRQANIAASVRAGAARLSFHLYNTPEDVDRALAAIS